MATYEVGADKAYTTLQAAINAASDGDTIVLTGDITEDSVSPLVSKFPTDVLDQWTYHSRLYAAAKYVADKKDDDINIVQLVSFGCGVDAITTDEMRSILERGNRIYTQIKIDEISNPGAVKIRLRSLFAATGR